MSQDKPRIAWITTNPLEGSSFASVTHQLLKRLIAKYEIHVLAFNYNSQPQNIGYTIHPFNSENQILNRFKTIKPDVTFYFSDFHRLPALFNFRYLLQNLIVYLPLETSILQAHYKKYIEKADRVLTTSKYSQETLSKAGISSEVVYHGIDAAIFKPAERHNSVFTFGFLGRGDDTRKQLPALLQAYKSFNEPSIRLLLAINQTNKLAMILQGLAVDPIFYIKKLNRETPLTPEEVAQFYHLIDCYVGLGTEGFGLPPLEAAATGIPNIAMDYGASREILGNAAHYIKPVTTTYSEISGENGVVDYHQVAEAMRYIKDNESERKKLAQNGIARAKKFTWEKAVKQLDSIIEEELTVAKTLRQPLFQPLNRLPQRAQNFNIINLKGRS